MYSAFGMATLKVQALREVIISGGVWGSPQLLMLSGIGPKEHLESIGMTSLIWYIYNIIICDIYNMIYIIYDMIYNMICNIIWYLIW